MKITKISLWNLFSNILLRYYLIFKSKNNKINNIHCAIGIHAFRAGKYLIHLNVNY